MRLLPKEIQVGDVAIIGVAFWKVVNTSRRKVQIHYEPTGATMWVGRYSLSDYNFAYSVKYSNLLPYPDRS